MLRYFLFASLLLSPLLALADECPLAQVSKKTSLKSAPAATTNILKTAASAGQFRTLVSLVIAADLDEALKGDGPFTVFAPTDDAFAKLPKGTLEKLLKPENKEALQGILKYHVLAKKPSINYGAAADGETYELKTLQGSAVTIAKGDGAFRVNQSTIAVRNIACSNGSIQVIDAVLLPPTAGSNTIPAVAEQAGTFKTLLAALKVAELAEVLAGEGPFTVFAPTDDAFAKLPKGTVEKLLKPENRKQLVSILKYHVVSGKVTARDLVKKDTVSTLQGESVQVNIKDGRVSLNNSTVQATDVAASNGLIHAIDRVLMPKH